MTIQAIQARWNALDVVVNSIFAAIKAFARGFPLLWSDRPRTPLRVLCLMAFDMLHLVRNGKPLPYETLRLMAVLLDAGACANAVFDRKASCRGERRAALKALRRSAIRTVICEYLRRLTELENGRPRAGGDRQAFQRVRLYRESVVRLSIGMLTAAADGRLSLDQGIRAIDSEGDLDLLLRMAMLCQIIDDILDYPKDLAAGLPSFLTASRSLRESFGLTRECVWEYADRDYHTREVYPVFPLRCALSLISVCARLVLALAGCRSMAHAFFQMSAQNVNRTALWRGPFL